jgi:hypothetical protein
MACDMNIASISTKDAGNTEKPYRFYPKFMGSKIVYPWIDQEAVSVHRGYFITTTPNHLEKYVNVS